jgi:electron transport complex protein RnfD
LIAGLSVYSLNNAVNPIRFTAYYMLSGGILFGAAFMLTDPVTSPINSPSRWIYGLVAGVLTIFIRLFAALPEGVAFSILISNMIAVALDHYEWSTSRYNWKNLLTMGLLVAIPALLVWIIISFGGVYNGQL